MLSGGIFDSLKAKSEQQKKLLMLLVRILTLHKKWSFPLRISSLNVTKYAVLFILIYWIYSYLVLFTEVILNGKLHFLCSEYSFMETYILCLKHATSMQCILIKMTWAFMIMTASFKLNHTLVDQHLQCLFLTH